MDWSGPDRSSLDHQMSEDPITNTMSRLFNSPDHVGKNAEYMAKYVLYNGSLIPILHQLRALLAYSTNPPLSMPGFHRFMLIYTSFPLRSTLAP
jgi:hypothetical protein